MDSHQRPSRPPTTGLRLSEARLDPTYNSKMSLRLKVLDLVKSGGSMRSMGPPLPARLLTSPNDPRGLARARRCTRMAIAGGLRFVGAQRRATRRVEAVRRLLWGIPRGPTHGTVQLTTDPLANDGGCPEEEPACRPVPRRIDGASNTQRCATGLLESSAGGLFSGIQMG